MYTKLNDYAYFKKLGLEVSGFIFYLFELYLFFHSFEYAIYSELTFYIYICRYVMLLYALPVLYLFRIAYYFDLGDALSQMLSNIYKFDNVNTFLQVKIFYYAIYVILSILLFFQALDFVSGFFGLK